MGGIGGMTPDGWGGREGGREGGRARENVYERLHVHACVAMGRFK